MLKSKKVEGVSNIQFIIDDSASKEEIEDFAELLREYGCEEDFKLTGIIVSITNPQKLSDVLEAVNTKYRVLALPY